MGFGALPDRLRLLSVSLTEEPTGIFEVAYENDVLYRYLLLLVTGEA